MAYKKATYVRKLGRVYYAEPNLDENGNDTQVSLEDLSIYVDLIVNAYSRFSVNSTSGGETNNVIYKLSWLVNEDSSTSFLNGRKLSSESDETFLTTYYTDITYDDTKNGQVVEGLGMSSIDIDYDSWYMPYITIKFIDVRGSSIFSPNEYQYQCSINSGVDNLSGGFFKSFMTFPYPLFNLVIKGFYGTPVTYRLNCVSFDSVFNSTTGNFEVTVKFIGYNYAFLSDISIGYLKAAPYDKYAGKKYFEEQRLNNPEWSLGEGCIMPTLMELEQDIANGMADLSNISQTDKQIKRLSDLDLEISKLNNIKVLLNNLILDLRTYYDGDLIELTNNSQKVILYNPGSYNSSQEKYEIKFNGNTISIFNNIISSIKDYNDKNPKKVLKYPNNLSEVISNTYSVELKRVFNNNNVVSTNPYIGDPSQKLKETFNDGIKLNENIIRKLVNESKNNKKLNDFLYVLETNKIIQDCDDAINSLNNERKEISKYVENFIENETKRILGFKPTIRNISKILFAHLDTFMYSIFQCVTSVGERSLGGSFNVSNSDINFVNGSYSIPPFPAVREQDQDTGILVDKWIGDVVDTNVPEVQLIYGFNRAVEQIKDADSAVKETLSQTSNSHYVPYFLIDICLGRNPFDELYRSEKTVGNLISKIGLRGLFVCNASDNSAYISEASKVDAVNYYYSNSYSKKVVEDTMTRLGVTNGKGVEKAASLICDYLMLNCDEIAINTQKNTKIYEFEMVSNHKMININGGTCTNEFIKINDLDLLPLENKPFNGSNSYVADYCQRDTFSYPKSLTSDNNVFYCNSDAPVVNYGGWDKQYKNKSRFSIVEDADEQKNICLYYNKYNKNPLSVDNLSNDIYLTNLFSKDIWKVDEDYFYKFYNTKKSRVATNKDSEKCKNYSLPETFLSDEGIESINKSNQILETVQFRGDYDTFYKYDDNQKNAAKNGASNFISVFDTYENNETLFGCPFYYMQNEQLTKGFTQEEVLYTKAFLFLSTFYINRKALDDIFQEKNGRVCMIPKMVALFIGCLLWRKRFCEEKGLEDCVLYESVGISNGKSIIVSYKRPYNLGYKMYELLLMEAYRDETGLNIEYIPNNSKRIEYVAQPINRLFSNYNIFNLDYSIQNTLIDMFCAWAKNSNNGFKSIVNTFELRNKEDGNEKYFDSISFINKVREFAKVIDKTDEYENMKYLRDNFSNNIITSYYGIEITKQKKGNSLFLYNRENTSGYNASLKLFSDSVLLIYTTPYITKMNNTPIAFNSGNYRSYISNFIRTLSEMNEKGDTKMNKDVSKTNPSDVTPYNELFNAMYLYFKKIYDAWLIGQSTNKYTLENFFETNFVFVDSFYNDIGDKMIINCEYLLNMLRDVTNDYSLFSFLAELYKQHGCIFVAVPNYINWNNPESISDMFDPLPTNNMDKSDSNKFVVMYAYEPSKTLNLNVNGSNKYGYKDDGFDIYDPNNKDQNGQDNSYNSLPDTLKNDDENSQKVISFGVSFAKQNQSYFKTINVGMSNPIITEQSIAAMYQIAENGGNNAESKGTFWGQDLYKVWSSYSYTCEVEMLGCAQIQPLMYFQLLNIPMFKGTYIVQKVTHNVKPGYMSTKIRGVRMSKYGKPFVTEAFGLFNLINKQSGRLTGTYETDKTNSMGENKLENIPNGEQKYSNNVVDRLKESYKYINPENFTSEDFDGCQKCNCGASGELDLKAKQLFLALKDTIKEEYGTDWSICVYSGKRNGSGNSDHNTGHAIDIAITDKNENVTGRKTELAIVFDILLTTYSQYLRQLIWENKSLNSCKADAPDNCVHFAVINPNKSNNNFAVFQAYLVNKNYETLRTTEAMSDTFLYCIAKKYNNNRYTNSSIASTVYSLDNSSNVGNQKEFLSKYYGESTDKGISTSGGDGNSNSNNNGSGGGSNGSSSDNDVSGLLMVNQVKNCPNKVEFKNSVDSIASKYGFESDWLMLFMFSESGLNPQAQNSIGATGLIQFTQSTANSLGTSASELLSMNANEQMEYVDKFFAASPSPLNGKIKNVVDLKLYGFAPSKLAAGEFTSKDSVVYDVGTSGWKQNYKYYTNGEQRPILVSDVQDKLFANIKSAASKYGFSDDLGKYLVGY